MNTLCIKCAASRSRARVHVFVVHDFIYDSKKTASASLVPIRDRLGRGPAGRLAQNLQPTDPKSRAIGATSGAIACFFDFRFFFHTSLRGIYRTYAPCDSSSGSPSQQDWPYGPEKGSEATGRASMWPKEPVRLQLPVSPTVWAEDAQGKGGAGVDRLAGASPTQSKNLSFMTHGCRRHLTTSPMRSSSPSSPPWVTTWRRWRGGC